MKNQNQDQEILAAFGEAMLCSHIIEDLLKLHLFECAYFRVNNCSLNSAEVENLKFECLIDEFSKVHKIGAALSKKLHLLRKTRNKLIHAFIPEVGASLGNEEGRDQIHAMLIRFTGHARRLLKPLQSAHEQLLQAIAKERPLKYLSRKKDLEASMTLATSDIEKLLKKLEEA